MSFMKQAIASMALILLATSVRAEPSLVEFTVQREGSTSRVTALMGTPTPISTSQNEFNASCDLRENPITHSSLNFQASDNTHLLLLPFERSSAGVKALISISKTTAKSPQLVEISSGCKVLLGTTSSAGITEILDLKWGKGESLKFPDGSVVTVVADDPKRGS